MSGDELSLEEAILDKFKITELPENPKYRELSQEIHLPFSYADYGTNPEHQASFIHEYVHLVQASSSVDGIGSFFSTTIRLSLFCNAIKSQKNIVVPIDSWANEAPDNAELNRFIEHEKKLKVQRSLTWGTWTIDISTLAEASEKHDFDFIQLKRKVNGAELKRWHVVSSR